MEAQRTNRVRLALPPTPGLSDGPRSPARPRRQSRAGLNKAQAEQLLDWLERQGCVERELVWEEGKGFTVSFVPPAAG
jgi:hypothetical protein